MYCVNILPCLLYRWNSSHPSSSLLQQPVLQQRLSTWCICAKPPTGPCRSVQALQLPTFWSQLPNRPPPSSSQVPHSTPGILTLAVSKPIWGNICASAQGLALSRAQTYFLHLCLLFHLHLPEVFIQLTLLMSHSVTTQTKITNPITNITDS